MTRGQLPLGIRLRDASVFASYFAGRNRPVVDVLHAIDGYRTSGGTAPTCIGLHGAASTGKTHLLQALCARAGSAGQMAAYVPLLDLAAPEGGRGAHPSDELLSGYGQFVMVCLDDVQAVAGRDDWERSLFRLHQELDEHGGRLIVSGSAPPPALGFRLRDLASRLNGGLVLRLHALDEGEQISALKLRAQLRGFELPEETAQFLLRRLPRDMARLCAFLDELDEASLIAQRRLTVPFVRAVMEKK